MNTEQVIVVDPAVEYSARTVAIAPRLKTLVDAHVGLIDNSKHMAEELLREVESLLRSRYGVKTFSRYRKSNASVPTPPDVLADLVGKCNAIVHGVAD